MDPSAEMDPSAATGLGVAGPPILCCAPGRKTWHAIKRAGFSSVDLDRSPFRPRSGLYVPYTARCATA